MAETREVTPAELLEQEAKFHDLFVAQLSLEGAADVHFHEQRAAALRSAAVRIRELETQAEAMRRLEAHARAEHDVRILFEGEDIHVSQQMAVYAEGADGEWSRVERGPTLTAAALSLPPVPQKEGET